MTTISVYEAKTQLSRLLRRVEAGEEVIIARDGQPVARLVGVAGGKARKYGAGEGKIWIAEDFDAPDVDAGEQPVEPPNLAPRVRQPSSLPRVRRAKSLPSVRRPKPRKR